jgi:hypothetical protein
MTHTADNDAPDHRNSDGYCGHLDAHESHWWGPSGVWWCNGEGRVTSPVVP